MSPPVVFLTSPEKLALEVRASGGYDFIVELVIVHLDNHSVNCLTFMRYLFVNQQLQVNMEHMRHLIQLREVQQ